MTTTQGGLLRAVLDDPEDDAPRLVYADLLEEQGQEERAAFIRVQCRLAGFSCDGRRHQPPCKPLGPGGAAGPFHTCESLRRRERELLSTNWCQWRGPVNAEAVVCSNLLGRQKRLSPGVVEVEFRRGFVSSVSVPTLGAWMGGRCRCQDGVLSARADVVGGGCSDCHGAGRLPGVGAALLRCQPVTEVRVGDREPEGQAPWVWVWYAESEHEEPGPHHLPGDLFDLLEAVCEYVDSDMCIAFKRFATRADALAALSPALVRMFTPEDRPNTNEEE